MRKKQPTFCFSRSEEARNMEQIPFEGLTLLPLLLEEMLALQRCLSFLIVTLTDESTHMPDKGQRVNVNISFVLTCRRAPPMN